MFRSWLVLLVLIQSTTTFGADTELPAPAIPGLRYYYPPEKVEHRVVEVDVCVYGGTSGGVVAAIQAERMGKSTVLLEFGKHVGGLTTGGLSHTDGGSKTVCGGIALPRNSGTSFYCVVLNRPHSIPSFRIFARNV